MKNSDVSDSQRNVIQIIEKNLQIRFSGSTKEEARAFISEHIEQSKRAAEQYMRSMRLLRIEEYEQMEEPEDMDGYFEHGWYNMPH